MARVRIPALAIAALLALSAVTTASAQTGQRALMKTCNVEANARHLMGRSRQTFMKSCLSSSKGRHLALNSQQRRMRYCNAQAKAKGLRGSDQRRYVNSCLRLR